MTLLERARPRKPVTWLTVVGLLLLPVAIGGVLIAALHSPTDRLENMRAAIVNDDDPVTIDGQYTPLGRQLAAGLVEGSDDEDSNLSWVLSNDEDAADGLEDGTYQAVITIPENFSAAAMSSAQSLDGSDEKAEQATIDVNTAPNALVADDAITGQVANTAADTMGDTLSEGVTSNLLIGFSTMGDKLGDAADGARELADGADDAADGAGELADGAGQVSDGIGELDSGLDQLADGAGSASTGAQELAGGAQELADGVPALTDGANGLAGGASDLASGIDQVEAGVTGDGGLAAGAHQLANGLAQGVDGIENADPGAALESPEMQAQLAQLSAQCRAQSTETFCTQLDAQIPAMITGVTKATQDGIADQLAPSVTGAQKLASGADQLGSNLPKLSDGAQQLSSGASQLAGGTSQLGDGASQLATGASGLADGVGQLTTGIGEAANNVPRLQDGATQVADGVSELGDGVGELGDGAGTLADGLDQAVEQVPSYSDSEAEDLASVIANPVTSSSENTLFGAASIPLLAMAVLWFGALATFLALRAVTARALTSRRSSIVLAGGALLPAAVIGAVQGALVAGIIQLVSGYAADVFWGLLGVSVLTGVAFAAVHQALVAVFGGAGRWVAGVVGAFAVAISIVSTLPGAMEGLRSVLPTTPAFDALLGVVGDAPGIGAGIAGLVIWAVLSFLVTTVAVATRRSVTTKALRRPSPA